MEFCGASLIWRQYAGALRPEEEDSLQDLTKEGLGTDQIPLAIRKR